MILAENGFVWACNAHELVPRYQHDCCEGHHIERICLDCDHELREELRLAHCHLGWGIAEQFKWHEGPKSPAPRVKWQNCKPPIEYWCRHLCAILAVAQSPMQIPHMNLLVKKDRPYGWTLTGANANTNAGVGSSAREIWNSLQKGVPQSIEKYWNHITHPNATRNTAKTVAACIYNHIHLLHDGVFAVPSELGSTYRRQGRPQGWNPQHTGTTNFPDALEFFWQQMVITAERIVEEQHDEEPPRPLPEWRSFEEHDFITRALPTRHVLAPFLMHQVPRHSSRLHSSRLPMLQQEIVRLIFSLAD